MLRRLLVLAIAMVATFAVAPSSAQATFCPPDAFECQPPVTAGYKGWARVNPNYCRRGVACPERYQLTAAAWRWDGFAWSRSSLRTREYVYAYPYDPSGWHWAWTQQSGWLAIETRYLQRA